MEKLSALVFVLLNVWSLVLARSAISTEDYCWRDFKGLVPSDAMSAGVDDRGKQIYIGQVLDGNKLIPGRIHEDNATIYYEFGEQAWSADENIKIFSTKHPENFEWISTDRYKVPKLKKTFIKGGSEPNCKSHVGRIVNNGIANVGKIICNIGDCLALFVNENDRYVQYHEFEILTYNPKEITENDIHRK